MIQCLANHTVISHSMLNLLKLRRCNLYKGNDCFGVLQIGDLSLRRDY